MTQNLAICSLEKVYHVGHLEGKPEKRSLSQEGPGLSISQNPRAWRQISGAEGPCWELIPTQQGEGKFVDLYELDENTHTTLLAEAEDADLIQREKLWKVWWKDQEWEETFEQLFRQRRRAAQELTENRQMTQTTGWVATRKLQAWWQQTFEQPLPLALTVDMALRRWLELQNRWDGVWWNHQLDPKRLSAPAGVIFPDQIKTWTARRHQRKPNSPTR